MEKCPVSVHGLAASEDCQAICTAGNLRNSIISRAAACFVLILAGRELFTFCGTGNFPVLSRFVVLQSSVSSTHSCSLQSSKFSLFFNNFNFIHFEYHKKKIFMSDRKLTIHDFICVGLSIPISLVIYVIGRIYSNATNDHGELEECNCESLIYYYIFL